MLSACVVHVCIQTEAYFFIQAFPTPIYKPLSKLLQSFECEVFECDFHTQTFTFIILERKQENVCPATAGLSNQPFVLH